MEQGAGVGSSRVEGHTHPEPCRPTLVCRLSCTPNPGSSFRDTFGSVSSSIFSLGWASRGGPLTSRPPHPQCQSLSAWTVSDKVVPRVSLGCVSHPVCNPYSQLCTQLRHLVGLSLFICKVGQY